MAGAGSVGNLVSYAGTPDLPGGGGGGGSNGNRMGAGTGRRGIFNGGMIQRIRNRRTGRAAARLGY